MTLNYLIREDSYGYKTSFLYTMAVVHPSYATEEALRKKKDYYNPLWGKFVHTVYNEHDVKLL